MDKASRMLLFADVVNCGSYTKTAAKRHLTRSVVSKQISKLEQELEIRLFQRTTRSMSLTEVGKVIYDQALKIRGNLEETENLVDTYQSKVQGLLRITSPCHFGAMHIQPLVYQFMAAYPEIQVELSFENRYVDLAGEGVDLAIRITHPKDSNLIARKLADNHVKIVASPRYLEKYGSPQSIQDLKTHRCVVYSAEGVLVDHWQYYEKNTVNTVQVRPVYLTNDGRALLDAMKAGVGIGLLATFMIGEAFSKEELIPLLPDVRLVPYSPIYAMYPSREHLPPKTEIFLKYIKNYMAQYRDWEKS